MTELLQTLADRQAIAELIARLGRWLDDTRTAAGAGDVLAADVAVETPGGEAQGLERVAAQAHRNHDGYRTQHVITNLLIDLDDDRADVGANLVVTFANEGGEPVFTMGERYSFEARRRPEGWRLSHIKIDPVWRAGERPS